MGNIHNATSIRQVFSFLSEENFQLPFSDYRVHKLMTIKCIKLILASQIANWESYEQISRELRTSPALQESIELSSISASQVSRRLKVLPTDVLESLFLQTVGKVKKNLPISCDKIGPVRIVDSTSLRLPASLANWAYLSRKSTQVKIHMRVLALPKGEIIPEKAIPSTGNVSDYETGELLVENDGTIYVMDRGYVKYRQFDAWLANNVRFVNRINEKHGVWHVEKELPIPSNSFITRDAWVRLGSNFRQTENIVRLVEFFDDQGRKYRIATSCFDLEAVEIANIYRQRWLIELFFKWMKQHLRLVKLYSHDPNGIWNQIFLALVAYAVAMLIQLESGTKLTMWQVLQTLRSCWYKPWSLVESELHPKRSRTSKGRQKVPEKGVQAPKLLTSIGIIKPRKAK
ncbi:IS4 family transposase [Xylanibacillus composti]|uniref:IS4 family transposase n=1 Tax=Xylanibacillus composti TaxID=1572762 RepID=UPI0028F6B5F8|nr:IS4 family transposase [Xylanibacillus composti]MDT9723732.1 IS4 family transposase [Xylanibacillus composti]